MEGKKYRAAGGRVRIDDSGMDVYSRTDGGMRLPWTAVTDMKITISGTRFEPRFLRVNLINGRSLRLPAPVGRAPYMARFEAQAREIIEVYEARGSGSRANASVSGEPHDEIPVTYRLDEARRIDNYAGPSRLLRFARSVLLEVVRPIGLVLLAVIVAGFIGLGLCIHTYMRDLPTYDAYRAASPCQAALSAEGATGPAYCKVTDGVAENGMTEPSPDVYELDLGPSEPAANDGAPGPGYIGPEQYAFFRGDQPALERLGPGQAVDYVAADGGDVASVTVHGATYQTFDSPQAQDVFDWSSIFAAASFTLVFCCLLGLTAARQRVLGSWALLPLVFVVALITNAAVNGDQSTSTPPSSALSLLGLTGVVAFFAEVFATALWLALRPRGPRFGSQRNRTLP